MHGQAWPIDFFHHHLWFPDLDGGGNQLHVHCQGNTALIDAAAKISIHVPPASACGSDLAQQRASSWAASFQQCQHDSCWAMRPPLASIRFNKSYSLMQRSWHLIPPCWLCWPANNFQLVGSTLQALQYVIKSIAAMFLKLPRDFIAIPAIRTVRFADSASKDIERGMDIWHTSRSMYTYKIHVYTIC